MLTLSASNLGRISSLDLRNQAGTAMAAGGSARYVSFGGELELLVFNPGAGTGERFGYSHGGGAFWGEWGDGKGTTDDGQTVVYADGRVEKST